MRHRSVRAQPVEPVLSLFVLAKDAPVRAERSGPAVVPQDYSRRPSDDQRDDDDRWRPATCSVRLRTRSLSASPGPMWSQRADG
jgi:hypothetical protein